MKPNPQLIKFIEPYAQGIQDLTFEIRKFIFLSVPETNELIWDNYNAVAMAYSKSTKLKNAFCHISVYSQHVNLGFNRGSELSSDKIELLGKGKLIRHIKVKNFEALPKHELKKLVLQAYNHALKLDSSLEQQQDSPKSLVMSVADKKHRPNTNK